MPNAITAAFKPAIPPPITTTLPGDTPGTPAKRTPLPPLGFKRASAPTCVAIRPATSLIGTSSGSAPSTSTVS